MAKAHKRYFAYIRVSKQQKPGQEGVSLPEQQAEIKEFAKRHGLSISRWFTETKTAASQGRPVFNEMLKFVRKGKAEGVLIHKVDRSARNYHDWHRLSQLIDQKVDVRFCHEHLDLTSRGGRLAADMMAVIATDYIRNLRDETLKGIRGRLRQGLYPMRAPVGYLDTGRGNPKQPDPVTAPLVRYAFERYASGMVALHDLRDELEEKGLRNKRGGSLSLNGLSTLLNNPFYIGIIRMRSWNEVFPGIHQPIIETELFRRVQAILNERAPKVADMHAFSFRRLMRCAHCVRTLIGERQKGHVYYRCHTRDCPTTCVREEIIEGAVISQIERLRRTDTEVIDLRNALDRRRDREDADRHRVLALAKARLGQIEQKLRSLADALLDERIDPETHQHMHLDLLAERQQAREKIEEIKRNGFRLYTRIEGYLERSNTAYQSYESANPLQKRELLEELTSNRLVFGKNVVIELDFPFLALAKPAGSFKGDPQRETTRTADELISRICDQLCRE